MMRYLVFLIVLLTFFGCSINVNTEQPTSMLMRDGNAFMSDKEYEAAATLFEAAVYNSDNPEQARIAQRQLADAYYADKKFPEAIASYEVYYDIYQDDPELGQVVYKLGMSYGRVKYKAGRDMTYSRRALDYFEELKDFYPNDYVHLNAEPERVKMLNRLADYEYQAARFYIRTQKPESAITRLVYLVNTYPDSSFVPDALALLAETSSKIPERKELVPLYLEELQKKYPDYEGMEELLEEINA